MLKARRETFIIDNSGLDPILDWPISSKNLLKSSINSKILVHHIAPETLAELFVMGSVRNNDRLEKLQKLALLLIEIFNGKILNASLWRIRDEIRDKASCRFMTRSISNSMIYNLRLIASGNARNYLSHFEEGDRLIRDEKFNDLLWRKKIKEMYRSRTRDNSRLDFSLNAFMERVITSNVIREMLIDRIKSFCIQFEVPNPQDRAEEIVKNRFVGYPLLFRHIYVILLRIWWYTESSTEGHRVKDDLFDDSLLEYLENLDFLVTQDKALLSFASSIDSICVISSDEFKTRLERGGPISHSVQ